MAETPSQMQRLAEAARALKRVSFGSLIVHEVAEAELGAKASLHPTRPALQVAFKLRNIALAQSHGISTARVYRVWRGLDDIDLSALPDEFVLKADGGSSAHAVFPLRKAGEDRFVIAGSDTIVMQHEIVDRLRKLAARHRARAPFFAEELLHMPEHSQHTSLQDIKVYCAYGEVLQILLIRSTDVGRRNTVRRYLDSSGDDLGEIIPNVDYDFDLPIPRQLHQLLNHARHLSLAVGMPFSRIDLYETSKGIMFGEITRTPGGNQHYAEDHDLRMGEAWLRARVRLEQDRLHGRPDGAVYGKHAYEWLYEDSKNPRHPSAWTRSTALCAACNAAQD